MPKAKTDKPKGRMSSYAYFVQCCREEHKKKHPGENVVFAEFTKKCASKWKVIMNFTLFHIMKAPIHIVDM
jgi:high mobility group protein B1